jgi:replicative DNA helicase
MSPMYTSDPRAVAAAAGVNVQTARADTQYSTATDLAEASLLGAMILSADALAGAVREVTPDDFARHAHRAIFKTLAAMHGDGDHVDAVTLTDRLVADGRVDEVGGLGAAFELTDPVACPTPVAWPVYTTLVRREGRRRRDRRAYVRAVTRLDAGEDPAVVRAALEVGP